MRFGIQVAELTLLDLQENTSLGGCLNLVEVNGIYLVMDLVDELSEEVLECSKKKSSVSSTYYSLLWERTNSKDPYHRLLLLPCPYKL